MSKVLNLFTAHPASVDESFGELFFFAAKFACLLFAAAGAALVHAILPFMFEKTASKIVAKLYHKTDNRSS